MFDAWELSEQYLWYETCFNLISTQKYPKLSNLLDYEELVATGVFQPELLDPDLSNPFSSGFWELIPLAQHYDKAVVNAAKKLINGDLRKN